MCLCYFKQIKYQVSIPEERAQNYVKFCVLKGKNG